MDAGRFDAFSRSLATRRSRRAALRGLGAGLFAAFGAEHAPAASGTCALHIVAKTSAGPHKNKTYSGTLNLEIGEGGSIDAGTFDLDDGKSFNLVGQATGRALNLRIKLGANKILELNGTAEIDLLLCRGDASGVFGGPSDTDIGAWRTGNGGSTGTTTSGGSTSGGSSTSSGSGGGSTSNGSGGGGSTSGGNASGGGAALCGDVSCPDGHICHQDACCEPQTCGPTICAETMPDGCGGEAKCGGPSTCTAGEVCYLNQCCSPRACQSYECGLHDDGCGGKVDCKDPCGVAGCDSDGTCCASCPEGGCGPFSNNCGTITTCPCAAGSTCVNGSCCAALNADCTSVPCCIGFCGQDNTCICNGSGDQCAHVGTGGCCNGDCLANDTCP